jgi:hypothetical protein
MKLTIATCQFPVSSDITENLRSVLHQAVAPDAAHGGDAPSGRATTGAEGDPAAGQHAERGGRLGEDGRWPQVQQVRDVGKERDAVGFGSQVSDERPDVEELRIASVVLYGAVFESRGVRGPGELFSLPEEVDWGVKAQAKGDRVSVVGRQSTYGPL